MLFLASSPHQSPEITVTLLHPRSDPPLRLRLGRDLTRAIKRGHPWVYAEALRERPLALPGTPAILLDNKKGQELARGFYDSRSPLAFRVCTTEPGQTLNEWWAQKRLERALSLRRTLFDERTTGFRLFNGEGDGLPGLIADIYGSAVVLQLDGAGPSGFWHSAGIAAWLAEKLSLQCVVERSRGEGKGAGRALWGEMPAAPVTFVENGVQFQADVLRGQKTGFFFDQRDNRQKIREVAANRRVLNVFGYTGGFSVYAGLGGASRVTTVDIAAPALAAAQVNWELNDLPPTYHEAVAADA